MLQALNSTLPSAGTRPGDPEARAGRTSTRGSKRSRRSRSGSRARTRPSGVTARRSLQAQLTTEEEVAIARLAGERAAEAAARAEASAAGLAARQAMGRQAGLLDQLAGVGVAFTLVAARLELLAGRAASPEVRARLARRLRKRRARARDPRGLTVLNAPSTGAATIPIRSADTTDAAKSGEEQQTMAQLVKRTITEEYSVDEDIDGIDEMDDEDEDLEEESDEVAPSRRSKK